MSNFHVREKHLFVEQDFIGHSGGELHWKIECDAITSPEWKCIARMIFEKERRPFQAAIGIPSCLLYTSPSPRDLSTSRMPSSA